MPYERVPTYFPAARRAKCRIAGGVVSVDEFRAAGDGSYSTSNAFAFGTGTLGLALAATTLAVNSSNNNARRAQAEADAQVTWREQVRGQIVVTDQGFYLVDQFGVFPWDWASIDMMQLAAFGCVDRERAVDARAAHLADRHRLGGAAFSCCGRSTGIRSIRSSSTGAGCPRAGSRGRQRRATRLRSPARS